MEFFEGDPKPSKISSRSYPAHYPHKTIGKLDFHAIAFTACHSTKNLNICNSWGENCFVINGSNIIIRNVPSNYPEFESHNYMVFSVDLSDLLIGVGFVAGVTFKTHLSSVIFIDLFSLW